MSEITQSPASPPGAAPSTPSLSSESTFNDLSKAGVTELSSSDAKNQATMESWDAPPTDPNGYRLEAPHEGTMAGDYSVGAEEVAFGKEVFTAAGMDQQTASTLWNMAMEAAGRAKQTDDATAELQARSAALQLEKLWGTTAFDRKLKAAQSVIHGLPDGTRQRVIDFLDRTRLGYQPIFIASLSNFAEAKAARKGAKK
jgi:hypothetical protein